MKVGNLVTWAEPSPYPEQCQIGVIIHFEASEGHVQIQWADDDKHGGRSWEQVQDLKVLA